MSRKALDQSGTAGRPGRFRILAILLVGAAVLTISIIGMSTREPSNEFQVVQGKDDAQRIFGGVFQLGDRLGAGTSPVQLQVFTDAQDTAAAEWFDEVIPALVDGPVREERAQLLLRNRSLTRNPSQISFFGIEAAGEQDYAWNYAYLVTRNLELAKELGKLDEEFLQTIAEANDGIDIAVWKADYEEGIEPGSDAMLRIEEQDKLAIELGLRAAPAIVANGPGGTEVLQDAPDLDEILSTIDEVR